MIKRYMSFVFLFGFFNPLLGQSLVDIKKELTQQYIQRYQNNEQFVINDYDNNQYKLRIDKMIVYDLDCDCYLDFKESSNVGFLYKIVFKKVFSFKTFELCFDEYYFNEYRKRRFDKFTSSKFGLIVMDNEIHYVEITH